MTIQNRYLGLILIVGCMISMSACAQEESEKESTVVPEKQDAFEQLFGTDLINAAGEKVSTDSLDGKIVGIYFSAHWCPPCRQFTPKLVETYNKLKAADKPFEIVFVSGDRSAKEMMGYMNSVKMPWLAVPFADPHKDNLSRIFNARSIPTLIILDAAGKMITRNGRGDVHTLGQKAYDKW